MASSHSLPHSSPNIGSPPAKRPANLPLGPGSSTSLNTMPAPQSPTFSTFSSPTSARPAPSVLSPSASGLPSASNHTRSRSPSTTRFQMQHFPQPSLESVGLPGSHPFSGSTHAGGILPSASFFRPSRPTNLDSLPPSRPVSAFSVASSNGQSPTDAELNVVPLSSLTRRFSRSSADGTEGGGGITDTDDLHMPKSGGGEDSVRSSRRFKSRDPLLPVHGEQSSPTRTSMDRMRNSIERVIRRGLSFDSKRPTGDDTALPEDGEEEHKSQAVNGYHAHARMPSVPSSSSPEGPAPLRKVYTFTPTRPAQPLWAVPDPKGLRNYKLHPSRNRFLLEGRLLTGGDAPVAFILSFMLALVIAGIWIGTTAVWWAKHESAAVIVIGVYMSCLTISSMLATAMKDPGILPRNLDPEPPYPASSPSDSGVRIALPRDLRVRNETVRVKYCPTCKTYRPPRSSHCKMCDNCVDGCDHHCQWVNNCVGRRNYTSFFAFLLSAILSLALFIVTSALHIYIITRNDDHTPFADILGRAWGSSVVFALSIVVIWPVSALFAYHIRLAMFNMTTIEQIRNQAHKTLVAGPLPPNPFSYGSLRRNFFAVLFRPAGYSWIDAHALVTEDRREVNPGLIKGGGWGENGVEGDDVTI